MILSILICTIPEREEMFKILKHYLENQISKKEQIEILWDSRKDINIGKKRNDLLQKAKGDFIVYIDDDDLVSEKYVELIVNCIKSNPQIDCIGINGIITTNGVNEKKWYISKEYKTWYEENHIYYRTPNHISPVKREIALKVGFPEKDFSEDFEYSVGILPYLEKECLIPEPIYHYKFNHK